MNSCVTRRQQVRCRPEQRTYKLRRKGVIDTNAKELQKYWIGSQQQMICRFDGRGYYISPLGRASVPRQYPLPGWDVPLFILVWQHQLPYLWRHFNNQPPYNSNPTFQHMIWDVRILTTKQKDIWIIIYQTNYILHWQLASDHEIVDLTLISVFLRPFSPKFVKYAGSLILPTNEKVNYGGTAMLGGILPTRRVRSLKANLTRRNWLRTRCTSHNVNGNK